MTLRTVCWAVLLLCLGAAPVQAQSFALFTGRNHPEIDWRTATTEHFRIVHPARLDGIAAEAAPIAEATYKALSANLDVAFQERIEIYLTDQDAIVNGFAAPFDDGFTNIWVNTNDWAASFTGPSWLRVVLAHELTHIFHYRATESRLGILGRALPNSSPRFWLEGVAQYQAETWNAQRGERWLRAAVLGNDLSYRDGRSLWNGRLLYASGHSQVRYLAQQHGDSTLADVLHHKKDVLFGLAQVHDFETAFREEVGESYEAFYEQWRRDMNVHYNTLASQLETLDSLRTDTLRVPGRYVEDLAYSPDTSRIAALTTLAPERPVRRLHVIDRSTGDVTVVAEGAIEPSVAWHPGGERVAFSRRTRAEHGSVLDDLFVVDADGDDERRLTYGRRTSAPSFGPAGQRLAFVATEEGTANVYLREVGTGRTARVTDYVGDVQITGLQWHPSRDTLALARVLEGTRELVLHALGTGASTALTDSASDDRRPVWSPDGAQLAYTSLRDGVPNAFIYDLATDTHRRATHLVRGATVHDWVPADSAFGGAADTGLDEALVTSTALSKTQDGAFRIPAGRTARAVTPDVPGQYDDWTATQPPRTPPNYLAPDPSLIETRATYSALSNLSNRLTFALPYYAAGTGDFGLSGVTAWSEPLGKHSLGAVGSLSVRNPGTDSEVVATYRNRQLTPTIDVSLFSASSSARIYGGDLLVEERTGGELSVRWPLDWRVAPSLSTSLSMRFRYADLDPLDPEAFRSLPDDLAPPRAGQQAHLRLQVLRRKKPPYRHTLVHPLDGWGLRLRATGAAEVLGGDSSFLRGDLAGYTLLPGVGDHRIFLYGRLQAQTGASFPQDYVGLSRYDAIDLPLPGPVPVFTLGDAERVRGYREYVLGNRVAFGSVEYRLPFASSLQTEVLGLVGLGKTTLSLFLDGGGIWSDADLSGGVQQLGTGVELKNALRLFGVRLGHALGVAQPALQVGTDDEVQVYYRVQTALPF